MAILYFILLIFVFLFVIISERKIFMNYLAPATIMSVSLLFSVLIYFIINTVNGFQINNDIMIYFILFVSIQFVSDIYVCPSVGKIRFNHVIVYDYTINKIVLEIGVVSTCALIFRFISLFKQITNVLQITYSPFQSAYGGGIYFFFRLINIIVIAYFIGTTEKFDIKTFLWIMFFYFPLIIGMVKGIVLIPAVSGFVLHLFLFETKIDYKKILKLFLIGIVAFLGIYMIEDGLNNPEQLFTIEFYIKKIEKFFLYICSGCNGFSKNLEKDIHIPDNENPTFAPFRNMFSKFGIVTRVDNVPNILVYVGDYKYNFGVTTNTNTYCGFLIIYNGVFKGLLIGVFWGIMNSILYSFALKEDLWLKLAYSIWSFTLIMACFDYWYLHSYWFYILVIIYIMRFAFGRRHK